VVDTGHFNSGSHVEIRPPRACDGAEPRPSVDGLSHPVKCGHPVEGSARESPRGGVNCRVARTLKRPTSEGRREDPDIATRGKPPPERGLLSRWPPPCSARCQPPSGGVGAGLATESGCHRGPRAGIRPSRSTRGHCHVGGAALPGLDAWAGVGVGEERGASGVLQRSGDANARASAWYRSQLLTSVRRCSANMYASRRAAGNTSRCGWARLFRSLRRSPAATRSTGSTRRRCRHFRGDSPAALTARCYGPGVCPEGRSPTSGGVRTAVVARRRRRERLPLSRFRGATVLGEPLPGPERPCYGGGRPGSRRLVR